MNNEQQPRRIPAAVLAVVLWIATAVLGLLDILAARDIVIGISARSGGDYWAAVNMANWSVNWSVVIMAFVWITVVIGGGEYHRSRVGQRSSWRLFRWTIAIEAAILVLSLFI